MLITGWSDKDGNSITYQPLGMFISPDGTGWSNMPNTKEQKRADIIHNRFLHTFDKVKAHLLRTDRTILEELALIKANKSTLPRYCKDFLLKVDPDK